MPSAKKHMPRHTRVWPSVWTASFVAFYFFYVLGRLDPRLMYQAQEPVFFFEPHFARGFLTYPGGLNELCSRFYAQFFYSSWSGSLALVLLFVSIAWVTRRLMRSVNPDRPVLYLHWIPSILLLGLHSDYSCPAALSLGLLWVLLGAFAYLRLASLPPWGRVLLFCSLQAILYYATAGQAFLFSLIAIGYELLHQRSISLALFCAAFAAVLPYAGVSTLFTLHLPDAYTANLICWDRRYVSWPVRPGWLA